jgi:hypothetical protein
MYDVEKRPATGASTQAAASEEPAVARAPRRKARSAGEGRGEGAPGTPTDQTKPATDGAQKATPLDTKQKPITVTSQAMRPIKAAPDTRKSVGIGESVIFYAETAPGEGVDGTWSASSGKSTTKDGQLTWVAPDTAGDATITFTPTDGAAKSVKMKVVAPSGLVFKKTGEMSFPKGKQGSGMLMDVTLAPLDVSFYGIKWKESDVEASNAKGFYAGIPLPKHVAAAAAMFGNDNDGPKDKAQFSGATGKLTEGSFDWVIPQAYIYNGTTVALDPITQTCTMQNGGSTVCSKATEASNPRSP